MSAEVPGSALVFNGQDFPGPGPSRIQKLVTRVKKGVERAGREKQGKEEVKRALEEWRGRIWEFDQPCHEPPRVT